MGHLLLESADCLKTFTFNFKFLDYFCRSKHVKDISIEGNRIKVIHPNDFDMLENLRTLHLRNNRIKLLWPKCFQGLENLEEIDLTSNHIKTLTKSMFKDTPKLKKLLLGQNRLRGMYSSLPHCFCFGFCSGYKNNNITRFECICLLIISEWAILSDGLLWFL